MKKNFQDKLTSYQNTINTGNKGKSVWENHPAFAGSFNSFITVNVAINSQAALQEQALTGITIDKSEKKLSLALFLLNVSGAIQAYARKKNDNSLYDSMNFVESKTTRMGDAKFLTTAQFVHDTAQKIIPDLTPFGISDQVLNSYQQEIDSYTLNYSTAPKEAKENRKNLTNVVLPDLFKQADTIVRDELLKLVIQFSATNPEFVNNFIASTFIGTSGTFHTRLRVHADVTTDSSSSPAPAAKATVTIEGTTLTGITDDKGNCTISKVPVDKKGKSTYNVIITWNGQSLPFPATDFQRGKSTTIKAEFQPQFDVPASKPMKKQTA
jgi:hypothetical protein